MGDRSAVGGFVKFRAAEKDPAKAELRAARAALVEQARALGGTVEFYSTASDVNPQFIADFTGLSDYYGIQQFFELAEDGLIELGQLGSDASLENEFGKLVYRAGEQGVVIDGVVTVYGEEPGDIWRLVIEGNELHRETPKIVWPNGDTE